MSTGAIVPYRPPESAALVELESSGVACVLRLHGVDRRAETATYDVMLVNQAHVGVSCRLYGLDARGRSDELGTLDVGIGSLGRSRVVVPFGGRKACETLYVEVLGDGVHLSAESRIPAVRARPWPRRLTIGACVLSAALAGAVAFALERPEVVVLDGPRTVAPGLLAVSYAIKGRARGTYRATTGEGTVLGEGPLGREGSIALAVPDAMAGRTIGMAVTAAGPFGSAERALSIAVLPSPRAPAGAAAPRIISFSAHRERYGDQVSILASYLAVGDHGTLRVTDTHGKVWGSAPFTHVGTTRVRLLPGISPGEPLRTELGVYRGTLRTDAAIEIAPDSSNPPVAVRPQPQPETRLPPPATAVEAVVGPSDPFAMPEHVVSGKRFSITIRRELPQMRIALQDQIGTTLDERNVSPGVRQIVFDAPRSTMVEAYYVVCTYERDAAEETLVRSLRVFPH